MLCGRFLTLRPAGSRASRALASNAFWFISAGLIGSCANATAPTSRAGSRIKLQSILFIAYLEYRATSSTCAREIFSRSNVVLVWRDDRVRGLVALHRLGISPKRLHAWYYRASLSRTESQRQSRHPRRFVFQADE